MKKIAVAFAALATASLLGAEVVHTPLEAWTTGRNPAKDANDAVWTASRRRWANDPVSASLLFDATISTERTVGYKRSGWYGENDGSVLFVVRGEGPYTDGACTYQPGEIVFKPTCTGMDSDLRRIRTALTFEVPRSGWYSMSATFRTADTGGDGIVDTTVILGGIVVQQQALSRPTDGTSATGQTCSFTHKFLAKGEKIEFVVGPRVDDWNGWWDAHQHDATALSLALVEDESLADETTVTTADFGTMLTNLTVETAGEDGSFADLTGLGTWSLAHFPRTASALSADERKPLSRVAASDIGTTGVAFRSAESESAAPCVKIYSAEKAQSLGVSVQTSILPFDTVAPGEVVVTPAKDTSVGLRFVPNAAGTYLVSLKVRDIAMSWDQTGSWNDSGVDVSVFVDGVRKDLRRISAETQFTGRLMQWPLFQTDASLLKAKTPIDVVIDPRTGNGSDETGLALEIVKLPATPASWNAGYALAEAAEADDPRNPFTSHDATWSAGTAYALGNAGDFAALSSVSDNGLDFRGWKDANKATILGNRALTNVSIKAEGFSSMGTGNGVTVLTPEEFVMVPTLRNLYSVCRFTVPFDGVYSVDSTCHDLNMAYNMSRPGVDCTLAAGTHIVAKGYANCDAWVNPVSIAKMSADRLYLRKGEVIDLGVMTETQGGWNLETGVRESIVAGTPLEVVSVDVSPNGATPYAGQGRVGFATATAAPWTCIGPSEGGTDEVSRLFLTKPDGEDTGASFRLAPPEGGAFSVVSGTDEGLLKDGVSSAGAETKYTWTLAGLLPNATYTLYFFGTGGATFAVGETAQTLSRAWFALPVADHAVITATADADGVISGTFSGSAEAAGVFCGLQAEGPGFARFRRGSFLIVR